MTRIAAFFRRLWWEIQWNNRQYKRSRMKSNINMPPRKRR